MIGGGLNHYRSANGGRSWTQKGVWTNGNAAVPTVHADTQDVTFSPVNTSNAFVANDGGMYIWNENTQAFTERTNGLIISMYYDAKASQRTPYTIIGGTQDNGGRLMNANGTWINTSGGDAMTQVMDTTTTRTFYSSCYGGAMYRTTNNWTSNTIISNNFPGGTPPKSNKWIMPFCLDANNPAKIIACYDTVWTSIDRGNTWAKASNYNFGGAIDKIGVTKKSSRVIYVSRGATVYRTGDTGLTWAAHSLAGINAGAGMNCIQVSPIDSNTVWVTCDGYNAAKKVFKTTDGGVSWSNISGSLPNVVCNGLKYENGSNNRVYLGTEYGGLYYIDDSMTDWAFYGDGLPNVEVRSVDIRYADKKLRLGTWGRGIWTGDLVNNATATIPYCDFSAANTVVRRGASATFSDLSTNTATSWAWNFPGGTPSSSMLKSPIIQYNTAGNYDVTLTVTNAAGTDSKTKTNYITVSAVTVPNTIIAKFNASKNSVAGGTTINFTDISTGAPTTWEWTFEGGLPATSTAQNPSITYNAKGTYRVMLTAKNGNGSNSVVKDGFIVTSSVVVGVETEHNDIYTAYSTKKTIYVNLKQSAQVYIYDLDGKLIETKPVLAGLNQFSTGISSGVYIVKIMLEKEVFTKRIIVE
jgi:PKD repeat protein